MTEALFLRSSNEFHSASYLVKMPRHHHVIGWCYSATCTADTAEIIVNSKTGETNYTSYYTIYKEISSVFHNVLCKGVLDNYQPFWNISPALIDSKVGTDTHGTSGWIKQVPSWSQQNKVAWFFSGLQTEENLFLGSIVMQNTLSCINICKSPHKHISSISPFQAKKKSSNWNEYVGKKTLLETFRNCLKKLPNVWIREKPN